MTATVTLRLEDGRGSWIMRNGRSATDAISTALGASTVHAFQGRTVDTVIAAMEANHPHLTTQKTLYVEISRARGRAELVTDDRDALRERLEAATGERISALEAVEPERGKTRETTPDAGRERNRGAGESGPRKRIPEPEAEKVLRPRGIEVEM